MKLYQIIILVIFFLVKTSFADSSIKPILGAIYPINDSPKIEFSLSITITTNDDQNYVGNGNVEFNIPTGNEGEPTVSTTIVVPGVIYNGETVLKISDDGKPVTLTISTKMKIAISQNTGANPSYPQVIDVEPDKTYSISFDNKDAKLKITPKGDFTSTKPVTFVVNSNISTDQLEGDLDSGNFDEVQKDIFGNETDMTNPFWFVYLGDKSEQHKQNNSFVTEGLTSTVDYWGNSALKSDDQNSDIQNLIRKNFVYSAVIIKNDSHVVLPPYSNLYVQGPVSVLVMQPDEKTPDIIPIITSSFPMTIGLRNSNGEAVSFPYNSSVSMNLTVENPDEAIFNRIISKNRSTSGVIPSSISIVENNDNSMILTSSSSPLPIDSDKVLLTIPVSPMKPILLKERAGVGVIDASGTTLTASSFTISGVLKGDLSMPFTDCLPTTMSNFVPPFNANLIAPTSRLQLTAIKIPKPKKVHIPGEKSLLGGGGGGGAAAAAGGAGGSQSTGSASGGSGGGQAGAAQSEGQSVDPTQQIYLELLSTPAYTTVAQSLLSSAIGSISGKSFSGAASIQNSYLGSPMTFLPLDVEGKYYMGVTMINLNPNSMNELTLHVPNKLVSLNGFPSQVKANFLTTDNSAFSVSAGFGLNCSASNLDYVNNPEVDILVHWYPCYSFPGGVQNPFGVQDKLRSFNLFAATSVAGSSEPANTNTVFARLYLGIGLGDFWAPGLGIAISVIGWDFSNGNARSYVITPFDIKLF